MRLKHFAILAVLGLGAVAYAQLETALTARNAGTMEEAFQRTNGQPLHRFTLTPDNTTAESNLTAAGGTAVTYTIVGGERICVQAITTDAYVEVIAAASMTAAGAKGFTVTAGAALDANCFTLNRDARSVSALCSAAGPCIVKGFEKR